MVIAGDAGRVSDREGRRGEASPGLGGGLNAALDARGQRLSNSLMEGR
jgi:hypothetical protein